MAYTFSGLFRIGGAIPGVHIYKQEADNLAAVSADGYFDDAVDQLYQGDVIHVADVANGAIGTLMVSSEDGVTPITTVAPA
mgnify:CR=1 FL=1|tara:strand:- start:3040 stop:3282 length:243 start_codon:yes stop_codon:yes gene_type:complete